MYSGLSAPEFLHQAMTLFAKAAALALTAIGLTPKPVTK